AVVRSVDRIAGGAADDQVGQSCCGHRRCGTWTRTAATGLGRRSRNRHQRAVERGGGGASDRRGGGAGGPGAERGRRGWTAGTGSAAGEWRTVECAVVLCVCR